MKDQAIYYREEKKLSGSKRFPLLVQGWYYLVTGLWPVLHIRSFIWVTGPKADLWLVEMVALLSISISISILLGYKKSGISALNYTAASSFLLIDIYYVATKTISQIYLVDAALQIVFMSVFILMSIKKKRK